MHFWNYVHHFSLGKQRRVWIAKYCNYDIKHVANIGVPIHYVITCGCFRAAWVLPTSSNTAPGNSCIFVRLTWSWGWIWGGVAMTLWCDVRHVVMLRQRWGWVWGGAAMTLWCDVVMWYKTCCDCMPEMGLGLGWGCNDVVMWCKTGCDLTPEMGLVLVWGCNDVVMWCRTCCALTSEMGLGLGWGCNDVVMWRCDVI